MFNLSCAQRAILRQMVAKELSTPDIPGFFIQSNLDADYIHLAASGLTTCKNGE